MRFIQYRSPEQKSYLALVEGDFVYPLSGCRSLFDLVGRSKDIGQDIESLALTLKSKASTPYLDLMVDARLMVPFHQDDTNRLWLSRISQPKENVYHWQFKGDGSQLTFPFWPLRALEPECSLCYGASLAVSYFITKERKPERVGFSIAGDMRRSRIKGDGLDYMQICSFGPELVLPNHAPAVIEGFGWLRRMGEKVARQSIQAPLPDLEALESWYFSKPWFCQTGHVHILFIPLAPPFADDLAPGDTIEISLNGFGRALVHSMETKALRAPKILL